MDYEFRVAEVECTVAGCSSSTFLISSKLSHESTKGIRCAYTRHLDKASTDIPPRLCSCEMSLSAFNENSTLREVGQ